MKEKNEKQLTGAREEYAAHAHRKADERGAKFGDSGAARCHAVHVKKVEELIGKWGNDFARAPRLTPNRRTYIELSSRLAIRKRHYCCTPSLYPLSALHKRDVPASENEKLPSKWEKRPVSV